VYDSLARKKKDSKREREKLKGLAVLRVLGSPVGGRDEGTEGNMARKWKK
jgi:hypothetical protein